MSILDDEMSVCLNERYPVVDISRRIHGWGLHRGRPCIRVALRGNGVGGGSPTNVISEELTVAQILDSIRSLVAGSPLSSAWLIVITGGEPLAYDLSALLIALDDALSDSGMIIVKTNGRLPRTPTKDLELDRSIWWAVVPHLDEDFGFGCSPEGVVDEVLLQLTPSVLRHLDAVEELGHESLLSLRWALPAEPTSAALQQVVDFAWARSGWRVSDKVLWEG